MTGPEAVAAIRGMWLPCATVYLSQVGDGVRVTIQILTRGGHTNKEQTIIRQLDRLAWNQIRGKVKSLYFLALGDAWDMENLPEGVGPDYVPPTSPDARRHDRSHMDLT